MRISDWSSDVCSSDLIGIVLTQDRPEVQTLKRAIEGVFEVAMRLINIVIRLAPLAVFCFMFNLAALFGWDLLVRLSAFVGVVQIGRASCRERVCQYV